MGRPGMWGTGSKEPDRQFSRDHPVHEQQEGAPKKEAPGW